MANIRRVHPGVYIKESLLAMEMTAKEFSVRTGISERTLSSIINGSGDITYDVAFKLATYFDNSITYWTNLQTQYKVYLQEQKEEEKGIQLLYLFYLPLLFLHLFYVLYFYFLMQIRKIRHSRQWLR